MKDLSSENIPGFNDKLCDDPTYCGSDGAYLDWEKKVCRPELERLGYSEVSFRMGEQDSFGPLSRIVSAKKDGETHRFVYG